MAQRRLLPYLFVLSCLCLYHNLLCFVKADNELCGAATLSLNCSYLGNISYPAPCSAASDSFQIDCSSAQAYWDAFTQALQSIANEEMLEAPALTGIFRAAPSNFMNLTWRLDFWMEEEQACQALFATTVNTHIPEVIDLTSFANGSFQLSSYNHILLLNCSSFPSSLPPPNMRVNNTVCLEYQEQCNTLKDTPCAQIIVPTQELMLQQALENFSCTHSQFPVATQNTTSNIQRLLFDDGQCAVCASTCATCFATLGSCVSDLSIYNGCPCANVTDFNSVCPGYNKQSCTGLPCGSGAKISTGAKIGIGVASAVTAMVIATLLVVWVLYRKRRYSTKSITMPSSNHLISTQRSSSNHLITQRAYMLSEKFGPVATKEFSFDTLSKATKCFADENKIGDGGFGAVYLGILENGCKVAVKRLFHDNFRKMDQFYNEIKILANLSHPNLVKLYGFCCEDSTDLLLVFEYASNGTVFDQLHDATKPAMPWETRLNIARETAEALSYLHNLVNPPIFHRDVKTTNILLDDDLHARLADFGLSRIVPLQVTHVTTAPQGTPGYLDPDYYQSFQLTDKSDVYSFGVVLVELVSGKLAVDLSRDRTEVALSSLALMKIGGGQWEDLVDPHLEMRKNLDVKLMVKQVLELAFLCLHAEKDSRPTMKHVFDTLASILCKEFDYRHDDDDVNGPFSFKVDINSPSSADETHQLIKSHSTSKSADSPLSSTDWMNSSTSSNVNSF